MTSETHSQMVSFIWDICNLLRGPYKRNEYRRVILPLTVLKRFDSILSPTKKEAVEEYNQIKGKSENIIRPRMHQITGVPFYNISKLTFSKLLDDANQIAPNLNGYINGFSANIREIFEKFEFADEIRKMDDKNLLYEVIKKFSTIDLSSDKIDNLQMGYIFEELIRIGAEQSNEEAGHHFTPREVIQLMVSLLLTPEDDLGADYKVKTVYDPACGTGGMLSEAEKYIKGLNGNTQVHLFGQDYNDQAWATCKADMLIKGEEADNVRRDNTFTKDRFKNDTFDYMLANPPFGVSWKQENRFIKDEADSMGYSGRFGAGLPMVNDGALLFLQHMISKMRAPKKEGSRIGIVLTDLKKLDKESSLRLKASEIKAIINALSERDETAEICCNSKGAPEPDTDLRNTEIIPLKEDIETYFKREVLPHVPDAWIDHAKTKVGYEIPLNRHFYKYEPPRELEVIEQEMKVLEADILSLLKEVTNGKDIEK